MMSENTPALEIKTLKRRNFKKLALPSAAIATAATSAAAPSDGFFVEQKKKGPDVVVENVAAGRAAAPERRSNHSHSNSLTNQLAQLELGVEFKLDLRDEDFQALTKLGSGNGGTVSKALHIPTQTVMAKKVIHIEKKPAVRKQIVRELHIMHDCDSSRIVSFFGAFVNQSSVVMCMEYMDCGSLDRIIKMDGPIAEDIIAKITQHVVEGLNYLYNEHRIIHRDVKPSNVLVNTKGQVKLCDFGVSGELTNSIAETFVGTSTYMSPERIQGGAYSVKGDVWSLGLTVLELAIGHFPFSSGPNTAANNPVGILDLLQRIVNEEPPSVPDDGNFSPIFRKFVAKCLLKEIDRPTPQELLSSDAFYLTAAQSPVSLMEWSQKFKITI